MAKNQNVSKSKKNNILVITNNQDQDLINYDIISKWLDHQGYEMKLTKNFSEAIELIKKEEPDFILLNINYLNHDFFTFWYQVNHQEKLTKIPMIFLSSSNLSNYHISKIESLDIKQKSLPNIFQNISLIAKIHQKFRIIKIAEDLTEHKIKKLNFPLDETEDITNIKEKLLQQKIISSERKIRGILAAMQDLVLRIDLQDEEIHVTIIPTNFINEEECYLSLEILNATLEYFFDDNCNNLFLKPIKESLENNTLITFNYSLSLTINNQLEKFYYSANISPLSENSIVWVARDITELKKVQEDLLLANQTLEILANLDGLTGIANRRLFDSFLNKEWENMKRIKQPLSLILIDVDFFKNYNDFYGHQMGDDCLIKVAHSIENIVNQNLGLFARYGGEEFGIILPNFTEEKSFNLATQIQEIIQSQKIPHHTSQISNYLTLTLGIATIIPNQNTDPNFLIKKADECLYQGKKQGRNLIISTTIKS